MGLIIILLVAQALLADAAADDQTVNESPCVSACRKRCFACYFRRCYVLPWCFNKCKAKCGAGVVSEALTALSTVQNTSAPNLHQIRRNLKSVQTVATMTATPNSPSGS
ncbi:hypothetical protein RHSIM_Rhsim12G0197100 [Rhododendron simsii]|uniref:Uncharacterized protein n=1 Tax=Rhododendron simsii TaxID=118357 RepID=A0A834G678_RHOSS|nr:hypothetical protein RHSIM_Rhsim12G0197100 [Rhododendron simsii]